MLALGREQIMPRKLRLSDVKDDLLTPARVSVAGSKEAEYDSNTWPELHKLALSTPEAGVHLQGTVDHIATTWRWMTLT
jgi:hypothetical protein